MGYKKPSRIDGLEDAWRWYVAHFVNGPWSEKSSEAEAALILEFAPQVAALMEAWLQRKVTRKDLVRGLTSLRLSMEAYRRGEAFEDFMIDRLQSDAGEEGVT